MNVLLVSPETPTTFWSFKHAVRMAFKRAAFPPLGLLTVAAMLPRSWKLKVVDLNVSRLRDADIRSADYVMISAMIVHKESVHEVIRRCRAAGKTVIGGGPLFTTGHEEFPGVHYVAGEAEELMDQLIKDMEAGEVKPGYESLSRPDVTKTPVPRWDLINPQHYAAMSVQFSRGCPYDCEFCDIIIMNGRKPRTKPPEQMLAELDALVARGWTGSVFIVDDNFIGNKAKVKEFLRALIAWQEAKGVSLRFSTEASVNLADDAELVDLMARAGFERVFLGIETPNPLSLEECQKRQNTRRDMAESIRRIQNAGMEVMGGFIIGFDSDPSDIFQMQFDFIQKTGIATAMVGLLTALPKTQLYERLRRAGRLLADSSGNNTEAVLNFVPTLDREFLIENYRRLMHSLYEPNTYYQRVLTFLGQYGSRPAKARADWNQLLALLRSFWVIGLRYPGRRAYWRFLATVLLRHRSQFADAIRLAVWGCHFRLVARQI